MVVWALLAAGLCLDRGLIHRCHILRIGNDSYRLQNQLPDREKKTTGDNRIDAIMPRDHAPPPSQCRMRDIAWRPVAGICNPTPSIREAGQPPERLQ
jgi:hypothetical protein